eukprot:UN24206
MNNSHMLRKAILVSVMILNSSVTFIEILQAISFFCKLKNLKKHGIYCLESSKT